MFYLNLIAEEALFDFPPLLDEAFDDVSEEAEINIIPHPGLIHEE